MKKFSCDIPYPVIKHEINNFFKMNIMCICIYIYIYTRSGMVVYIFSTFCFFTDAEEGLCVDPCERVVPSAATRFTFLHKHNPVNIEIHF